MASLPPRRVSDEGTHQLVARPGPSRRDGSDRPPASHWALLVACHGTLHAHGTSAHPRLGCRHAASCDDAALDGSQADPGKERSNRR